MPVYKYVGPDRIDALQNGMIRFTQLSALNDPFDALPNVMSVVRHRTAEVSQAIRERFGEHAQEVEACFHELVLRRLMYEQDRSFVFLSLSKTRNNVIMWGHYAAGHTGFAIGFDEDSPFFAPSKVFNEGLRNVTYSERRWEVSVYDPKNLGL